MKENDNGRSSAVSFASNRDGIRAKLNVQAGDRLLVDEVRSGSSFDSNSDIRGHFGLGSAATIEWVQVRWPSGLVEHFENLAVDSIHTLKEGSGIRSQKNDGRALK